MNSKKLRISTWIASTLALFACAVLLAPALTYAESSELAYRGDRAGLKSIGELAEWRSARVDVPSLLREDEAVSRKDVPLRIGFPMTVDLTPANSGTWETLPDGGRLWRLKVVTEGALWTVVGFDTFRLQEGGALSVQDASGQTILGPYTSAHVRDHGELWFPPIGGDTVVIELYWPAKLSEVEPALHLGTVSHGYKAFGVLGRQPDLGGEVDDPSTLAFGDSGSCNVDVACPEAADWQDDKRGIVILLSGGSGFCTGSLINTTAGDCRPYVLTAAHCSPGPSTTFGFNFERPGCNSGTPPAPTNQTVTGATVRAAFGSSDFSLLEMSGPPPESFGAYFNGWSRDPAPAQFTYVIHHPRGDAKKIAFDADAPINGSNWGPNHWRIDDSSSDPAHRGYEWGTTEPGSSGSPLFDHNHRIVGQLHGGLASCTSDTYDEYGKVDASWVGGGTAASRLSDWLDPAATGALFVNGVDHSICLYQPAGTVAFTRDLYACSDTLTITLRDDNIPGDPATVDVVVSSATETVDETVTLTQIQPGQGRYSGTIPTTPAAPVNGDGLLSVAHGDILTVNYVDADDGDGGIGITVKDNADVDCQPPQITNVQSSAVTGNSALITWDTDEASDSRVTHGLTPPGSTTATNGSLVLAHSLQLSGLTECSVHYYSVASADAVGNLASDNNAGSFYTFETGLNVNPSYPSGDTPIAIPDNNPTGITSTIPVADNKTVLDVDVLVNITHTYTGDLSLTLITPTGATILLSNRRGGSGDNFVNTRFDDEATATISAGTPPFTGSYRPDQPLSAADGINAAGNWSLRVIDHAGADIGPLNNWTLILTFPTQACGPNAKVGAHFGEEDQCASGGLGDADGTWDAGEQVKFSVTIENDGNALLTGVSAQIVPQTPGVVVLDGVAGYPNIPVGTSSASLDPHFIVRLPQGVGCGDLVHFDVTIDTDQGSWNGSFSQVVGTVIPGGGVAFTENFNAGIPVGWTIVDGLSDGNTWYGDSVADPEGCGNTDPASPLGGGWAQVDSDCAGSGINLDEQLISPVIDLSAALSVTLDFDHWFRHYSSSLDEKGDVDVRSSLTAGQWVNVRRWQGASSPNPDHASIDITAQAAGASDVQIRWHYYDASFEWTWSVDNVVVAYTTPAGCDMVACAPLPGGPTPIPDGGAGTQPLLVGRLVADGSQLELSWDDQCAPTRTKVIYGPLDQVGSYSVAGSVCDIGNPQLWDPVPGGDLWFVLVSDDNSGNESSWGQATGGERNGLTASGTCGSTLKDVSGICP